MVRTEVAEPDPGVTLAGEKEQLRVAGIPGQESAMGVFNDPDCVCAVTVKLAAWPAVIDNVAGDAPKVTTGGGELFELHEGV
jgi:hypothetical protein